MPAVMLPEFLKKIHTPQMRVYFIIQILIWKLEPAKGIEPPTY